jgi:hypothetical protein
MAEEQTIDNHVPVFTPAAGGLQFYVTIPKERSHEKWIKKLGGTYFQRLKAYTFLRSDIAEVEKELGVVPGTSGIRDPRNHHTVVLTGMVYAETRKEATTKLAEHGFTWNKARGCFEGSIDAYDKISGMLSK